MKHRSDENTNENTTQESKAARIVEENPVNVKNETDEPHFFGRRVLTWSIDKEELTPQKIGEILPEVLRKHDENVKEINYLYDYYKGKQPILNKTKIVRPEINNKVIENHAFEIVEFKKAYVYGEPVQYVQKGEKNNEVINPDIAELNKYMESEDKSSLDKELAEWQYICGTAYRWIDEDEVQDEDDAPFEIRTADPRQTFVVYSSGIKGEQLFAGNYSWFSETLQVEGDLSYRSKYRIITIYTDKFLCKFKENFKNCSLIEQDFNVDGKAEKVESYPLVHEGHRIIEYPLNQARLGLIELVMSPLNAINRIKSDDLDGIDQFVQSLLVFVNQEVEADKLRELLALGAVEINSATPDKPADLKLLVNQLVHSETKVVTDDLYGRVLQICGIPRQTNKVSGGDTGQARLLGEGWTMADERAKQDELAYKKSERKSLKTVLSICKGRDKLLDLKLSDIDIKFTRNKSDNLLVKTQGLMNMQTAQVPPEVAFTICGLFSDPNEVYTKAQKFYGENFWKDGEAANIHKIISAGEGQKLASQQNKNEDGSVKNGNSEKKE